MHGPPPLLVPMICSSVIFSDAFSVTLTCSSLPYFSVCGKNGWKLCSGAKNPAYNLNLISLTAMAYMFDFMYVLVHLLIFLLKLILIGTNSWRAVVSYHLKILLFVLVVEVRTKNFFYYFSLTGLSLFLCCLPQKLLFCQADSFSIPKGFFCSGINR